MEMLARTGAKGEPVATLWIIKLIIKNKKI